jgi:hypothetical protein
MTTTRQPVLAPLHRSGVYKDRVEADLIATLESLTRGNSVGTPDSSAGQDG